MQRLAICKVRYRVTVSKNRPWRKVFKREEVTIVQSCRWTLPVEIVLWIYLMRHFRPQRCQRHDHKLTRRYNIIFQSKFFQNVPALESFSLFSFFKIFCLIEEWKDGRVFKARISSFVGDCFTIKPMFILVETTLPICYPLLKGQGRCSHNLELEYFEILRINLYVGVERFNG